jgi:hypothetical protein
LTSCRLYHEDGIAMTTIPMHEVRSISAQLEVGKQGRFTIAGCARDGHVVTTWWQDSAILVSLVVYLQSGIEGLDEQSHDLLCSIRRVEMRDKHRRTPSRRLRCLTSARWSHELCSAITYKEQCFGVDPEQLNYVWRCRDIVAKTQVLPLSCGL